MTTPRELAPARRGAARRLGAVAGVLAAAVAIGVSQLVAGITGVTGAPVPATGSAAIDLAPPALKNFAISTFGSSDKNVLIIGTLVVLAVLAAVTGAAAVRRLGYGLAGLGILMAVGLAAALTRPHAGAAAAVPTLVGAVAGGLVLVRLIRAVAPAGAPGGAGRPDQAAGEPDVPAGRPAAPVGPGGNDRPPAPYPPPGPDRRRFLINGGVSLAVAGVGVLGGRVLGERASVSTARSALRFPAPARRAVLPPGTDLHVSGQPPFVTPNSDFYRVDTALILPQVSPESWRLRIHGMVAREIEISFDELLRRPLIEHYTTLTCVSEPIDGPYIGNARWLGASLPGLLRAARPRAGADQLLCTSADGFTSGTPLAVVMDGREATLTVAMNGTALPVAHGFPARMVVPGLYGYVSATKWVTDIKVTTFAAERAYWAQRGWSQLGPIKTESRIDVPGGGTIRAGRTPVAGVAWAQHKGIDAVHVRVDRGAWQQARLAAVPGIDTWRQWVWEWDATPGTHLIEARATDVTGFTQTAAEVPPEPNGATGYPSVRVTVR
ncbi:MAG TPA: molybdopterin-dependent oxidoreductase [Streptosporangiaceae bacterium]|nr:molybdopterin-dependent oxidoreductase [Streptosporangiaceae bacterium]